MRNAGERAKRRGDRARRRSRPPARRRSPRRRSRDCARRAAAAPPAARRRLRTRCPRSPRPRGHDLHARALEDPQLGVAVGLERAVAIEVVRLEVEQHRDVAGELVHVLELEGRELADDPVGGPNRRERRADVPGDRDVAAGRAEDRAEQLGRRRLAVRPGHADEARAAAAGDSRARPPTTRECRARAPPATSGASPGTPGDLDEHVDPVEQREVVLVRRASGRRARVVAALAQPPAAAARAREAVDERSQLRADVAGSTCRRARSRRRRGSP